MTSSTWASLSSLNSYGKPNIERCHAHTGLQLETQTQSALCRDKMLGEDSDQVADVGSEFNEVVFHSYVPGPGGVLPPAADVADLSDQSVVQVVQQTVPPGPVLCMST